MTKLKLIKLKAASGVNIPIGSVEDRIYNPQNYIGKELPMPHNEKATILMSNSDYTAFPSVFWNSTTQKLELENNWRSAENRATTEGNSIRFKTPEQTDWFANNGYKMGTPLQAETNPKFLPKTQPPAGYFNPLQANYENRLKKSTPQNIIRPGGMIESSQYKYGGTIMKKAAQGMNINQQTSPEQLLQAFAQKQGLNAKQYKEMIKKFQSLPPQEQQQTLVHISHALSGGDEQEPVQNPQEEGQEQMKKGGRALKKSTSPQAKEQYLQIVQAYAQAN